MLECGISRESPIPLYYQIRSAILDYIAQKGLRPGNKLPTEKVLQERFGVSRTTVRLALDMLARDGILRRQAGKGTFVVKPCLDAAPRLQSLTEEMRSKGYSLTSKVLRVERVAPAEPIRTLLRLRPGEQALLISRLRYLDGEPTFIFSSWLPARLNVSEDDDFSGSLYELLEKRYGIVVTASDVTVEAGEADVVEADLLNIRSGAAVLRNVRISYTDRGDPVEYLEATFRADRYRQHVRLVRTPML